MRTRTEGKRREIVQAAADLFVENGFDRTSMNAISERVGGSKATLYGYFDSKEALLRAVLAESVAESTERVLHEFPADGDLRPGFIRLGKEYLTNHLSSLTIANVRTVATRPEESGIGAEFYADVLCPAWEELSQRLAALMTMGRLRAADPWVAAMQWKGLADCELFEKRLLGAVTSIDPAEITLAATLAADAFLRIYEPEGAGTMSPP